ncbi:nuclear transcription factor Y subunit gamma [Hemitrygon akajei]|uniref:nuclear transcription factor Y subunit gamma n=1 Tax=Hemitrygon akajei TaxID=2704970 RepID=UPI003BF96A5F
MSATADSSFSTASQGGGNSEAQHLLQTFWPRVMEEIRNLTPNDFKMQDLPLARIKKIMKLDEDVKMISAEAPVLFAKAAQIFITELSLRAWIHTEDNKRRTLQRNDIAMAITKFDQFDFLIDIVPRDELKPPKRQCPFECFQMSDNSKNYRILHTYQVVERSFPFLTIDVNRSLPNAPQFKIKQVLCFAELSSQDLFDFKLGSIGQAPVYVNGPEIMRVESFKLLGVNITSGLS